MNIYYRIKSTGKFILIETTTKISNKYYCRIMYKDKLGTYFKPKAVSKEYLKTKCERVPKSKVPEFWVNVL